jgi:AraC-like DNA-binding protein
VDVELVLFGVDAAAVVLAVLLGLRLFRARPADLAGQLAGLLALAIVAHVVLARHDYSPWMAPAYRLDVGQWRPALNLARNAGPGLFMLLAHRLFTDRRRLPPALLPLFGLQLFLEEPVQAFLPAGTQLPRLLAQAAPTALQLLFVGLAVFWTIESWRQDLVEARRRARLALAAIIGVNAIASSLLLRVVIPSDTPANYHAHQALSVLGLATLAAVAFAFLRADGLDRLLPAGARRPPAPEPDARDAQALAALERLMAAGAYQEPGLSLKTLADRVALPEYRLRRLIHRELGLRNFSAFLHRYRVAEACRRLRDPGEGRTPILTIALSVGYTSVNTFNRGFREVTGVTPSEYRAAPDEAPAAGGLSLTET